MSRIGNGKRFVAIILVVGGSALCAGPSNASRPVPRTIQGCVINGVFISHDGYRIRVWHARREPVDLSAYEGKEIRYFGSLLPADNYYVKTALTVIGPCLKVPMTR